MKYLLCQISLTALLFAQTPMTEAKQKALCDAFLKEFTYLQDDAALNYLQSLVSRMDSAEIRIVEETEAWADYRPCGVVLITKGFLQKAASEREVVESIAHMVAHSRQQPLTVNGWIVFNSHHPRALVPKALEPRAQELEAEVTRRATEIMSTFPFDPESRELMAFQQRYPLPVRKKPTLYR